MRKGIKRPDLQRARIGICPICGNSFRAIHDHKGKTIRHQIYCSRACWNIRNPIIKMSCPVCGKEFYERVGRKKYCSHKCYSEHLKTIKGDKAPRWDGGKTKASQCIRTSSEYRMWRYKVLERDNFTCQMCGAKTELEAHHIKEFSKYPEKIFEINNGVTLCHSCHIKTDSYLWKSAPKPTKRITK